MKGGKKRMKCVVDTSFDAEGQRCDKEEFHPARS